MQAFFRIKMTFKIVARTQAASKAVSLLNFEPWSQILAMRSQSFATLESHIFFSI